MSAPGPSTDRPQPMEIVGGGGLVARVDPARGAKITSLRDRTREWLAQAQDHAVPPPGTAFVDAEMSGWDECAPSIVACTVDDLVVPDHGALWDAAFGVVDDTVRASALGFSFSRTIRATPEGLRFAYTAVTEGRGMPFLWAAHPQFVAPTGTVVRLPDRPVRVFDVLTERPRAMAWSADIAAIDTVEPGGCRKVYVDPAQPMRSAVLVHPDGAELTLEWSSAAPYLGLWFDAGAYSREPVIAVEPSTGYFDSLRTAVSHRRVAVLEQGVPLEWWIDVRASSPLEH